eukprot:scaffold291051_cov18-Tisochrysis_lutea.AAC.1
MARSAASNKPDVSCSLLITVLHPSKSCPDLHLFHLQSVTVLGDELIARLDGPSGDVQMGGDDDVIAFSAKESEDPSDPFNTMMPMRYQFGCVRLQDELKPCFKDVNYFGETSGSQWFVNVSQFAEENDEYYMYVTIVKGSQGESRRTASAAKIVLPRSRPVRLLYMQKDGFQAEVLQVNINQFCPGDARCSAKHVSANP